MTATSTPILGGIDWTIGRWDSLDHKIFDPEQRSFPGVDYCNFDKRWGGEGEVDERVHGVSHWWQRPTEDVLNRAEEPRQPWQDLAVQVWGAPAAGLDEGLPPLTLPGLVFYRESL